MLIQMSVVSIQMGLDTSYLYNHASYYNGAILHSIQLDAIYCNMFHSNLIMWICS